MLESEEKDTVSKFTEIIRSRSQSQVEDFLEYLIEKGLDDQERYDIIPIIEYYFTQYNNWNLVLLIDLTSDETIISKVLIDIYLKTLFETKTFYIKLSILDYINQTSSLYKEANVDIDFSMIEKLAYSKKNKLVVRNQALLILIKHNPSKKNSFLSEIKTNIQKSDDYRTHIRLYTTLVNNSFYKEIPLTVIYSFMKISKTKNLGRGADVTIKELESKLLE